MEYFIFIIIAYLLGSIPTALIVGKVGYDLDIRDHGSGNLGATNAFRVLGIKAGTIVIITDILKGTLAAVIPLITSLYIDIEVSRLIVGLFAVLGHTYPLFAKFNGGKAVATSAGLILGVQPLLFIIIIITFLLTLYLSKYVSLASMVTGVISTLVTYFFNDTLLFIIVLLLTLFVLYRHRENIKRIRNKTEPKIKWM